MALAPLDPPFMAGTSYFPRPQGARSLPGTSVPGSPSPTPFLPPGGRSECLRRRLTWPDKCIYLRPLYLSICTLGITTIFQESSHDHIQPTSIRLPAHRRRPPDLRVGQNAGQNPV